MLCLLGDCLKETGDRVKAKQCYNQAFIVSAEIREQTIDDAVTENDSK